MTSTKKIISGAAFGTILGTLAAFIYPRRKEILERARYHSSDLCDLTDKAKEFGSALFNKGKKMNFRRVEYRHNYWKSGIIGLIVGAGTALLMAPKTGKSLRGQLTRVYNDFSEKSEDVIHQFKNNSNPFSISKTHQNGVKKRKPALKAKKSPIK